MFGDFDFKRMSERDVRGSVLALFLRELGYRHSTNTIITEQTLKYPKLSLGRKKTSDPELRGKADYILEVDGRRRWVLEAKADASTIPVSHTPCTRVHLERQFSPRISTSRTKRAFRSSIASTGNS